jgi:GcrA cell cycle regulator
MNAQIESFWTADRIARLTELWLVDGWSAGQIARDMGATSRSAVIGKVHRLGLKRDGASVPTVFKPYPKRKAVTARRKQTPAPSFLAPGFTFSGPVEPTPPVAASDIQSPNAKVWTERGSHQCAFPVGGQGADAVSCCNRTAGKSSYCVGHDKLMRVPGRWKVNYGNSVVGHLGSTQHVPVPDERLVPVDEAAAPPRRAVREPRTFDEWAAA